MLLLSSSFKLATVKDTIQDTFPSSGIETVGRGRDPRRLDRTWISAGATGIVRLHRLSLFQRSACVSLIGLPVSSRLAFDLSWLADAEPTVTIETTKSHWGYSINN
jgi:hypothetical protein